jgi:hypothetical protein
MIGILRNYVNLTGDDEQLSEGIYMTQFSDIIV